MTFDNLLRTGENLVTTLMGTVKIGISCVHFCIMNSYYL